MADHDSSRSDAGLWQFPRGPHRCHGQPFDLWSGRDFDLWRGRDNAVATVLIFTRADCPISNRYAPTVRSLHSTYQTRGVDFFLVYVDSTQMPDKIRRHLLEYQYPCEGVHDPSHELVKMTGATVTPEAVVFDSERKIAYRGRIDDLYVSFGQARSAATTHDLADALEAVLAGKTVPEPVTQAVGCSIGDLARRTRAISRGILLCR